MSSRNSDIGKVFFEDISSGSPIAHAHAHALTFDRRTQCFVSINNNHYENLENPCCLIGEGWIGRLVNSYKLGCDSKNELNFKTLQRFKIDFHKHKNI
jgi:hypothetical protein